MTTSNSPSSAAPYSLPNGAPSAARATLKLLMRLKHGTLTVKLPDGSVQRFVTHEREPSEACADHE